MVSVSSMPKCRKELSFGDQGSDNRSYRVNFDKIASQLPGFACDWDAEKGAAQLHAVFERIGLTKEMFESRDFTRLKMLEYLLRTGQIDEHFFWVAPAVRQEVPA